jgi:hypothetical protein
MQPPLSFSQDAVAADAEDADADEDDDNDDDDVLADLSRSRKHHKAHHEGKGKKHRHTDKKHRKKHDDDDKKKKKTDCRDLKDRKDCVKARAVCSWCKGTFAPDMCLDEVRRGGHVGCISQAWVRHAILELWAVPLGAWVKLGW